MEVTQIVAAARRVLAATPYGFLTTMGPGGPSVRLVQHLNVDEDLRVIFGTGRHTRKAAELQANPGAVYAAADPATRAAVCLYGEAAIDEDLDHRRAGWIPELERYFPHGPGGPEFVLVSIRPHRIEAWSAHDRIHPDPLGQSSAVAIRSGAGWAGPAGDPSSTVSRRDPGTGPAAAGGRTAQPAAGWPNQCVR